MTTTWVRDPETGKLVKDETKKKRLSLALAKPEVIEAEIELEDASASMSKTELVLMCQWWINRKVPKDIETYEARYGSAFHEAMAVKLLLPPKKTKIRDIVKVWNEGATEKIDVGAMKAHVKQAHAYLIEWLKGDNIWGVNFIKRSKARTEQSFIWDVSKKRGRATSNPTQKGHRYRGVKKPTEFPGTADVVIDEINTKKDAPDVIVIDYKTGESCDLPKKSAQLKSLVNVATKRMGYKRAAGGIFHTPREGAPYLYIEEFTRDELNAHANELQVAWTGIGSGTLRPGPWCYKDGAPCPAFTICPVHTSAINQLDTTQRGLMTPEKIGRAHEIIQRFTAWSKVYKDQVLRPFVVKHGPVPRPDGKLVTLRKKPMRDLSMSSITRKLGRVKGEKRIAELDAEGLIEHNEIEMLIAVDDK